MISRVYSPCTLIDEVPIDLNCPFQDIIDVLKISLSKFGWCYDYHHGLTILWRFVKSRHKHLFVRMEKIKRNVFNEVTLKIQK